MDDHSILELIRTGKNDSALNKLYSNYPPIRKMVRAHGGGNDDAEDVFQEALIILLRRAADPQFQLTAKLSTYLYSVARFIWNDQLRKSGSQISLDVSDTRDTSNPKDYTHHRQSAGEFDIAEAVLKESRIRLAEQALNELKDRCRELLLLFYQQKLSLSAIATKMGYGTENSAKNQKYKCLEAARTRLKELQLQTQTL